jgi:lambda family phage portal protein
MALRDWFRWARRETGAGSAAPMRRAMPARAYLAAQNDRLTADIERYASQRSANADIRPALKVMRSRARHVAHNNGYARKFIKLARNNVAGPSGFHLQMRVPNRDASTGFDEGANAAIERAWMRWSRPGTCTVDGRLSRADFERLVVEHVVRDGEVLIRLVRGYAGNPYAFAVQLIEADLLDEELNIPFGARSVPQGLAIAADAEIRMGVEQDAGGRPIAYWLRQAHPGDDLGYRAVGRWTRVPADQIIHAFMPERIGASRGVPWFYSGLRRIWMLGQYEEAELTAARVAASKMAFYTQTTDADAAPQPDAVDETGQFIREVEPGILEKLPAGWDLKTFDPAHPVDAFGDFVKYQLRGFAAGLGIPYETLVADLESANYSSLRHGELAARDEWRTIQEWMRASVLVPIFEHWLEMSLLSGALNLTVAAYDRYNAPHFMARGWQWVDPAKEIQADTDAVKLGVKTRAQICAERGLDFEDVLRQLAREKDLAEQYGVTIDGPAAPAAPASQAPQPEDTENDDQEDRNRSRRKTRR